MPSDSSTKKLFIGLGIAALYFIITALPAPDGLTPVGKKAIAMMLAAVLVWVFEVIPIAVSSILFTLLPVVAGIIPLPKVMAHFATPTVFFVFAMFCISIAFQDRKSVV